MVTPQESFGRWAAEYYDHFDESGQPNFVCKRCGMIVGYLTKHAAVRHGDPIEVMPAVNDNPKLAEAY